MLDSYTSKIALDSRSSAIIATGNLLCPTWRFFPAGRRDILPARGKSDPCIYCFWHASLLTLGFFLRGRGLFWLISSSRDGQRAAAVLQRWGHGIIQGSSSRGGMRAVRTSLRSLDQGSPLVITPDGPRGPREIAKPGVAQIALIANAPVIPLSVKVRHRWNANSWDRFLIPKPFARIDVHVGHPIDPASFRREPLPEAALLTAIQRALQT